VSVDESAVAAHRGHLRTLCAPGAELDATGPYASVRNRQWFRLDGSPRAARAALHDRLVAELVAAAPDVEQSHQAVVLAGPPGAGKSQVIASRLGAQAVRWRVVDADHFKEALLADAVRTGWYEELVPPAVRAAEVDGDRFFPLELASLVHEESSRLAARARVEAIERGDNLVIDTVLSSESSALALGERLSGAGYSVTVVDVETTFEISAARIEQRWHARYVAALESGDPRELGGRWVPSEYPRDLFATAGGRSRSEEVARTLTESCDAVMRLEVYRVATATSSPTLHDALERPRRGGPLVDAAAAEAARVVQISRARPPRRDPETGIEW
jgi:chloramphenicol 3-O-phosphotransferase